MSSKPAWISALEKELQENPKSTSYALSTLTPDGLPKARFVIHRSITPSSNLLVTTTDTRMQKPKHLAAHSAVEVAWWIEATNVQFRISGPAVTIASPSVEGEEAVQAKLKLLSPIGDETDPEWWEQERARLWKSVSGHLRAGFARPTPGTPLDQADRKPEEWSESIPAASDDPEKQKEIDEAFAHFALLVIKAEAAEYLELKPQPNVRTQWKRQGEEWAETKVCP